eukprot:TRINITY_DN10855_c4_g1_i1.p1 TRINITY_DN10855_c4_g1~~TRINITY_DN10855_c4_g1_i1.p1  ORF type:complete len:1249 (+),score=364.20 TRINITY_DN10855_c4_g1_i1:98-3748(+)
MSLASQSPSGLFPGGPPDSARQRRGSAGDAAAASSPYRTTSRRGSAGSAARRESGAQFIRVDTDISLQETKPDGMARTVATDVSLDAAGAGSPAGPRQRRGRALSQRSAGPPHLVPEAQVQTPGSATPGRRRGATMRGVAPPAMLNLDSIASPTPSQAFVSPTQSFTFGKAEGPDTQEARQKLDQMASQLNLSKTPSMLGRRPSLRVREGEMALQRVAGAMAASGRATSIRLRPGSATASPASVPMTVPAAEFVTEEYSLTPAAARSRRGGGPSLGRQTADVGEVKPAFALGTGKVRIAEDEEDHATLDATGRVGATSADIGATTPQGTFAAALRRGTIPVGTLARPSDLSGADQSTNTNTTETRRNSRARPPPAPPRSPGCSTSDVADASGAGLPRLAESMQSARGLGGTRTSIAAAGAVSLDASFKALHDMASAMVESVSPRGSPEHSPPGSPRSKSIHTAALQSGGLDKLLSSQAHGARRISLGGDVDDAASVDSQGDGAEQEQADGPDALPDNVEELKAIILQQQEQMMGAVAMGQGLLVELEGVKEDLDAVCFQRDELEALVESQTETQDELTEAKRELQLQVDAMRREQRKLQQEVKDARTAVTDMRMALQTQAEEWQEERRKWEAERSEFEERERGYQEDAKWHEEQAMAGFDAAEEIKESKKELAARQAEASCNARFNTLRKRYWDVLRLWRDHNKKRRHAIAILLANARAWMRWEGDMVQTGLRRLRYWALHGTRMKRDRRLFVEMNEERARQGVFSRWADGVVHTVRSALRHSRDGWQGQQRAAQAAVAAEREARAEGQQALEAARAAQQQQQRQLRAEAEQITRRAREAADRAAAEHAAALAAAEQRHRQDTEEHLKRAAEALAAAERNGAAEVARLRQAMDEARSAAARAQQAMREEAAAAQQQLKAQCAEEAAQLESDSERRAAQLEAEAAAAATAARRRMEEAQERWQGQIAAAEAELHACQQASAAALARARAGYEAALSHAEAEHRAAVSADTHRWNAECEEWCSRLRITEDEGASRVAVACDAWRRGVTRWDQECNSLAELSAEFASERERSEGTEARLRGEMQDHVLHELELRQTCAQQEQRLRQSDGELAAERETAQRQRDELTMLLRRLGDVEAHLEAREAELVSAQSQLSQLRERARGRLESARGMGAEDARSAGDGMRRAIAMASDLRRTATQAETTLSSSRHCLHRPTATRAI